MSGPATYRDRGISTKEYHRCCMEHQRQLAKWGVQERTPFEWLTYVMEEVGELAEAIAEHAYRGGSRDDVIKEATHAATLLLKIMRMYDLKEMAVR